MDRTGATKEEIDSSVKFMLHFPMGIFELADFTGMDVIHKATLEMYSRDKKVINPHPLIEKLYNEKKLGQKSGEGFYRYSGEQYDRRTCKEIQSYSTTRKYTKQCSMACYKSSK
jgi:enoyl-CoA hydratase/3-hydroxyacyl-CoA dehydrogenase